MGNPIPIASIAFSLDGHYGGFKQAAPSFSALHQRLACARRGVALYAPAGNMGVLVPEHQSSDLIMLPLESCRKYRASQHDAVPLRRKRRRERSMQRCRLRKRQLAQSLAQGWRATVQGPH